MTHCLHHCHTLRSRAANWSVCVCVLRLCVCVQVPCGCASYWTPTANQSRSHRGCASCAGGTAWTSAPWRTVTMAASWPIWPTLCPRALLALQVRWHLAVGETSPHFLFISKSFLYVFSHLSSSFSPAASPPPPVLTLLSLLSAPSPLSFNQVSFLQSLYLQALLPF